MIDFILPAIFTIIFALIILFFQFFKTEINTKYILSIFLIKLLSGIFLYLIYTYYYSPDTSDLYIYFKGGLTVFNETQNNFIDYLRIVTGIQGDMPHLHEIYSKTNHWTRAYDYGLFVDNKTMIRFNALLCLISRGNVYLHIVVMSFLSFLGSFALYKAFLKMTSTNKYLIMFAAFLIPSTVFWTSGLLKEGLVMFSMGFMFYYLLKALEKINVKHILFLTIFTFFLLISKIYILPSLIPGIVFYVISKKMRKRTQTISFFSIILIILIFTFSSKYIIGYDIPETIAGKQNDFINYTSLLENKGSTIELKRLDSNLLSIIKNTPQALINSFVRPFPTEIKSIFLLISFLENILILACFILMLFFFKKFNNERFRFSLFVILVVILFYTLIGISTPNLGAIARYKAPILPFLVMGILNLLNTKKLLERFSKKS